MTRRIRHVLIAAPDFRPWDLGTYLSSALTTLRVRSTRFSWRAQPGDADQAFVAAVRQARPDAVIGLKMDGLGAEALARVRRSGVPILLWQVDCFTDRIPGWIAPLVREASVVAVTAHGMVPAYARLGETPVHWVMEGAHLPSFPAVRLPAATRALYASEVAFVGGLGQPPVRDARLAGRRLSLLTRLGRHFDVTVWGPQTPAAIRRAKGRPFTLRRWPAYNDELSRVCRATAIMLGVNTINTVPQYFSNRTFLTLAARGFHLTHYVPGLEALFENHRHLVWFKDDRECEALCRYYLSRPDARARIARAGHRRVVTRWSLTMQAQRLLEALMDRPNA